jgi:NTP pyrophosphatase (non-canonical NTP hydrolase)
MALSVEAAELVEEFQWLTEEQSRQLDAERRERVRLELADVFIYLLRIADTLGVDLLRAADDKIVLNERKYPAERVRGDSRKYTTTTGGRYSRWLTSNTWRPLQGRGRPRAIRSARIGKPAAYLGDLPFECAFAGQTAAAKLPSWHSPGVVAGLRRHIVRR